MADGQINFDMRFAELMKDVHVTVKLTDWRGFYFRATIAKYLFKLAFLILGTKEIEVID